MSEVEKNRIVQILYKKFTFEQIIAMARNADSSLLDFSQLNISSSIVDDDQESNQVDARNFVSVRVFSNKFKDDIKHNSLEKHALLGDKKLAP